MKSEVKARLIEKALSVFLNLFKVKSLVTFAVTGVFVYVVITNQIEVATTTAIIMLVIQNLFDKDKKGNDNNEMQSSK